MRHIVTGIAMVVAALLVASFNLGPDHVPILAACVVVGGIGVYLWAVLPQPVCDAVRSAVPFGRAGLLTAHVAFVHAVMRARMAHALVCADVVMARAKPARDARLVCNFLTLRADLHRMLDHLPEARADAERALAMHVVYPKDNAAGFPEESLAQVMIEQGDYAHAHALAQTLMQQRAAVNDSHGQQAAAIVAADALVHLGRLDEAQYVLNLARALRPKPAVAEYRAMRCDTVQARLFGAAARFNEALGLFHMVEGAAAPKSKLYRSIAAEAAYDSAVVMRAMGDNGGAISAAERASGYAREVDHLLVLGRAQTLLGSLKNAAS